MKRVQSILQVGDVISDGEKVEARVIKHLGYAIVAKMNTGELCALVARVPSLNGKQNHDVIMTLQQGGKNGKQI